MESSSRIIFISLILAGLLCGVFGHSYVTKPISRSNQAQSETGCRGPACLGPCDVPLSKKTRAAISTSRGETLTIQWPRNNHAGGFIRFAWAPTSQSDSMSAFDNGVQQINCHEVGGCAPSDPSNPNGGDNGPADGSSNPCQTTIKVPDSLADGAWTLQWAWFGGAFALGDYYSCVDYQVSGGDALASTTYTPVYIGGDWTYPGQNKCKFFNTDKLHVCIDEPCNNPIYPNSQEESGPAAGFSGATVVSSSSSGSSAKATSTSTTGKSSTSSTSAKATSTSTTGKPSSTSTSGKATSTSSTSTSGKATSTSTGKTSTSTSTSAASHSSSSTTCEITGAMKCASSETFLVCDNGAWSHTMSCAPGTTCSNNGNYITCGF